MYILEIFFKKRKYSAIFNEVWKAIGDEISLSQAAETSVDPQLELVYFLTVYYAAVFHAALAAGMSSSSAHYLARIQTQKSKIDKVIIALAQEVFSAPDDEKLKRYADQLNTSIQGIVAAVETNGAENAEFKSSMSELTQCFHSCGFSVNDMFSSEN